MCKHKKALIICNGDAPTKNLLFKLWEVSDLRVAADGGANLLYNLDLFPDAIIGDFDSLKPEVKKHFSNSNLFHISFNSIFKEFKFKWVKITSFK